MDKEDVAIMSIWSLAIAILAVVVSLAAWWETRRQANASEKLSQIAVDEQKANFERWLAANKPWLRVYMPVGGDKAGTDNPKKYDAGVQGTQVLMQVENYGKLPCRLGGCLLDGKEIKGELLRSSKTDGRIMGFFNGARLAPGEWQLFYFEDIPKVRKEHRDEDGDRLRLEIEYFYEPKQRDIWPVSLVMRPLADTPAMILIPIDSTAD